MLLLAKRRSAWSKILAAVSQSPIRKARLVTCRGCKG